MQIIPDASLEGLKIANDAAAGLRDVGDKIQNWKHAKRIDTLMAARQYADMASQMGNRIAQQQSLASMGDVMGLNNEQLAQLQAQDPYVSGLRGLGVENNNPELEIAMANGLVSKDTPYQITGSESDRNAEIWNRGYTAMMDAYKKGDMAKAMEIAIQTDRDQSLNAQQFNKDIKGPGALDILKGLSAKGGGTKRDQMYGYDTKAKTWVPISMARDVYENESKRNSHLAKNYPNVDPNKLQYGGEDAGSKFVAKGDTAKAEYSKAMDNAGTFIKSITGVGSDLKRKLSWTGLTDSLREQIDEWNTLNVAGPVQIGQNESGQVVAVPNKNYVFNDYLDTDTRGLVVSNEWSDGSGSQVATAKEQARKQLSAAVGEVEGGPKPVVASTIVPLKKLTEAEKRKKYKEVEERNRKKREALASQPTRRP